VLAALYELVRGFQAADEQSKNILLREVLAENPNHVYGGLLTVLMRLVFHFSTPRIAGCCRTMPSTPISMR